MLGRLLTLEQVDNPPLEVGEPGSLALVSIAAGALAGNAGLMALLWGMQADTVAAS